MLLAAAAVLFLLTGSVPAQDTEGLETPVPSLPFLSPGVCPFEGCVYRDWIAREDVPAYDTWGEERTQLGTIQKREAATALGGMVVTYRPGVIHLDRDIPEFGLRKGDTIYTYAYHGEGYSQVWVNGRFHELYDISFTKWPDGTGCGGAHCAATYLDLGEKTWWAELKRKSGETVWVKAEAALFQGTDYVARPDDIAP